MDTRASDDDESAVIRTLLRDALSFGRTRRARFEARHAARVTLTATGEVVGAETIAHMTNAGRAVLVLHGFNDTPQSMAHLASALAAAHWSVLVPRLPGHGVSLPRMARESRYAEWLACAEQAYQQLCATHHTVVLCGQSMGGALATVLASRMPNLPALVLLAPYVHMPRSIVVQTMVASALNVFGEYRDGRGGDRSIHDPDAKVRALGPRVITARTMRELRFASRAAAAALPSVHAPTLYVQSREDNRISTEVATAAFTRLGCARKAQHWVEGCGHIISADYCRDEVARVTREWFDATCSMQPHQATN